MDRYYFHAAEGSPFRDADGEELSDIDEAKVVALDVLTEMISLKSQEFFDTQKFTVSVKDGDGRMVI